ncbi:MAG: acetolactate synthase small subunit [Bacteroidaceae bacterium]|nr:acetolactate synthase small subunit [Bacteroidaceae bacterium]
MNSNPFASELARPEAAGHKSVSKFPVIDDGKTWYTLIIVSENLAGVLNQITNVFTRRQLNIESLNVSPSGYPGLHRYTVTCRSEASEMKKLVKQIEKKIDVVLARFYTEDEVYVMEQALYKISTARLAENHDISKAIRQHDAKIVEVNSAFSIVSIEGLPNDIVALRAKLQQAGGMMQFVSSGIVAVTRSAREELSDLLERRKREELSLPDH